MNILSTLFSPHLLWYMPLTNRVRDPYLKLRTESLTLRFMAQARSARAINRRGINEDL